MPKPTKTTESRKRKNNEQWEAKHLTALTDAETQRQARDQHPAGSPRWDRHNEAMLQHDLYASYAFRKMHESLTRNGVAPTQEILALWPDLGTPHWKPAQTTAWGLYRARAVPLPPRENANPSAEVIAAQITPHSVLSVPRTTRDSKQTCEHLFTYWTRRIAHATNMRDQARNAGRPAKLIAKWQHVIDKAHAKRGAYAPVRRVTRNHSGAPSTPGDLNDAA